jgi:hypothetical protein
MACKRKEEYLMDKLEYAKLSGVEIPKELLKVVAEAQGQLSNIREKLAGLESERAALETEIRGLVTEEAAAMVKGDSDSKKLSVKRQKGEQRCAEIGLLLAEIGKLEAAAKTSLEKAEENLAGFISDRLAEGRALMKGQVEQVMEQRGISLNRTGTPQSTPPERSSKSRIATCEICGQDIGIFNPRTICQPVSAGHFEKLPRFTYPPFNPRATIEYFRCPYCGKKPWGEHDRILTNMGYFCVPEKKEEKEDGR